ncbi:MAG: hypothetical protein JO197_05875 [Acidobacteria bacterium]|nr:hypothetical protein [Acidobacteriota bacterium]MBV9475582.1 hypothetical protein [Acidobacteriota bacterium]
MTSGTMAATLGRLLQLVALVLLPIGLSYGLMNDNVAVEVRLLGIGGALFVLGWLLARKPST